MLHDLAAEELANDLDGLFEHLRAHRRLRPVLADDVLVERLARADAQVEAARIHRRERGGGLRQNRRMIAEAWSRHAGAELDGARLRAERAEPGPDERRLALLRHPGIEVVGGHDGAEANILGLARPAQQVGRMELLEHRGIPNGAHALPSFFLHETQEPLPLTPSPCGPQPLRRTGHGFSRYALAQLPHGGRGKQRSPILWMVAPRAGWRHATSSAG